MDGAFEAEGAQRHIDADLVAREIRITLGQLPTALGEGVKSVRVLGRGEMARQFTTEIAVTDRRIIYKTGFIARHTAEMNMHRVETVAVEQGIFGRMLNYGLVHIRGTGAGIENLTKVADPLALRSAITAPTMYSSTEP